MHGDEREPVEEVLVVDQVVAPLEEVVLIRVIVLEENEFPMGVLLAQEGASMGHDFLVEVTVADDEDLSEVAVLNQVVLDELPELSMRLFTIECGDLDNREDLTVLDEEVPESSN